MGFLCGVMNIHSHIRVLSRSALILALAAGTAVSSAKASSPTGIDAKAAFARMKSLSGDWTGPKEMGTRLKVNFRTIAGGSAVVATFFPGKPQEMISVYYMDGNNLVQTHYCVLGNQPHMKLNTKKSSADTLVFDFAGGDNIKSTKMNMHGETIRFLGKNKIESMCSSQEKGKPNATNSALLVRKS